MSNGRPFRDNTFKPNGRPFTDTGFKPKGQPFQSEEVEVKPEELDDEVETEMNGEMEETTNTEAATSDEDPINNAPDNETTSNLELEDDAKVSDPIIGDQKIRTLVGSDMNDRLIGKKGNEVFTGGLGEDKFRPGKGDDIITDFEIGTDRLLGKFKDAVLSKVDGGTLLEYKKGSVLFEGLDIEQVETLL